MKSKKLIVYELENGAIAVCATKVVRKDGKESFSLKQGIGSGQVISGNVTDDQLGKVVRKILKICE